jgi:hypothetical protein
MNQYQTPPGLVILAVLFLIRGILAIFVMTNFDYHGQVDVGLFGLFIGPGLLCHVRAFRFLALMALWYNLFTALVYYIYISFFLTLPPLLITVWGLWILNRPDVRFLFERTMPPGSKATLNDRIS